MRTGAIVLTRRARLEAISAAISWFLKFIRYKSLELSHESDFGDFHLMSDGKRIQLTWWLTVMPRADAVNKSPRDKASSDASSDVAADCDNTGNANESTQSSTNTSTNASTNASDCCDAATRMRRPRPRPEPAPAPRVANGSVYEVAEAGFQKWLEQVVNLSRDNDRHRKTAPQHPRATGNAQASGSGG